MRRKLVIKAEARNRRAMQVNAGCLLQANGLGGDFPNLRSSDSARERSRALNGQWLFLMVGVKNKK